MGVDTLACIGILIGPMVRTKGQATLKRALDQKLITQAEVAEATGASQPSVCAWAGAKSRPLPVEREALRRCYAIPVAWWLTDPERKRLGRLRLRRALVSVRHAARVPPGTRFRKVNNRTGDSMDRSDCSAGRA